ncbi:MAG: serine hydrolase domain-containing protein [Bacteroidota bacterium]
MKSIHLLLGFVLSISTISVLPAQHINQDQLNSINALFSEFKETPAVSYGIVYKNKIYQNTFGRADFYSENTNETFRLGGMTPHFVAYLVLQLEEKNLLNLDDEVSSFLTIDLDLQGIKIIDLLRHTSALPEYWALKSLAGYSAYDPFPSSKAEGIYSKSLEKTGAINSKVFLSGTGPYVLTRVIEKVTGKSIEEFARDNLFIPLKMKDTYFCGLNTPQRQNIISYTKNENNFEPQVVKHYDSGPAGLITTMNDLLVWFQHFEKKGLDVDKKMDKILSLENGMEAKTADGAITFGQQFTHIERGLTKIWDYGHIGGFASSVFRFPEHELSIIILSKNGLTYNGFLGMQISDILLDKQYSSEVQKEVEQQPDFSLSFDRMNSLTGAYFNRENYNYREIRLAGDTLNYHLPEYNLDYIIQPTNEKEFILKTDFGDRQMEWQQDDFVLTIDGVNYTYEKLDIVDSENSGFENIAGDYYNEDFKEIITIARKNDQFVVCDKNGFFPMQPIGNSEFVSQIQKYKFLSITTDENSNALVLKISNSGYKNVPFKKINSAD